MSIENPTSKQESKILWTAVANRLTKKIQQKIDEALEYSPDGNDYTQKMYNVIYMINEIFPVYENNNKNINQVESDLEYRINNANNEKEKEQFQIILALVQVKASALD